MNEYKNLIIEVYYGKKDSIIEDIDYISLNDNIVEIHYSNSDFGEDIEEINIHDLAHKCKQRASEWDYEINSSYKFAEIIKPDGTIEHGMICEFEPYGVFDCLQWILENKGSK